MKHRTLHPASRSANEGAPRRWSRQTLGVTVAMLAPCAVMVLGEVLSSEEGAETAPNVAQIAGADCAPTQFIPVDGPGAYEVVVDTPSECGAQVIELIADEPFDFLPEASYLAAVPETAEQCEQTSMPIHFQASGDADGAFRVTGVSSARYRWSILHDACRARWWHPPTPTTASRFRLAVATDDANPEPAVRLRVRVSAPTSAPRPSVVSEDRLRSSAGHASAG